LASVVVLAAYLVPYVRLGRARREWQLAQLAHHDVYMSERFGPAVFGFLAPRIVVPQWVRDAEHEEQELIVLHENEHIRARDQLQLLLAILATIAMPWNPLVWIHARRLRFAIETDCDQRVLAAAPDRARYASLLVNVGAKQMGLLLTPALAEHRNGLERRLEMLASNLRQNRWKAAAMMVMGVVLTMVACESRLPQDVAEQQAFQVEDEPAAQLEERDLVATPAEGQGAAVDAPKMKVRDLQPTLKERRRSAEPVQTPQNLEALPRRVNPDDPQFTPYTKAPELTNRDEVMALLVENYPPLLRDAGIGGTTTGWLLIDENGSVIRTRVRVRDSSGHEALDAAAQRVLERMKFTPAEHNGMRIPVWIQLPVVFKTN
jgi:TonB family protein